MAARMFCRTGELAGADFEIADDSVIGRSGPSTIVLPTPLISQSHARISRDSAAGRYFIEDMGSRNGTRLDGLEVRRRTRLDDLHVITFAEQHDFIFQVVAPPATEPARPPATEPAKPPAREPDVTMIMGPETRIGPGFAPPFPSGLGPPAGPAGVSDQTFFGPGQPLRLPDFGDEPPVQPAVARKLAVALEVLEAAGGRRQIELVDGTYDVGRSPECGICLADRTLSRRHARLDVAHGRAMITDLGSENGTFVGGQRIASTVAIAPGTEITLGEFVRLKIILTAE